MIRWIKNHVSAWAILGGLLVGGCGALGALAAVWFSRPPEIPHPVPSAVLTVIPAPSATPSPAIPPGPPPTATVNPQTTGGITLGKFVQISGTAGEGLRLRTEASKSGEPKFLGMDAEVFQVKDGPRQADNLMWWYLVSPTDPNRAGWAAADYLSLVPDSP